MELRTTPFYVVERVPRIAQAMRFDGTNRETIIRWILTRHEFAEVLREEGGRLAVPVLHNESGEPLERVFERVYEGEYVLMGETGLISVVDEVAFFNQYAPYVGDPIIN